jgi:hypothetical protein
MGSGGVPRVLSSVSSPVNVPVSSQTSVCLGGQGNRGVASRVF